jgi:hypothetical protein
LAAKATCANNAAMQPAAAIQTIEFLLMLFLLLWFQEAQARKP